MRANHIFMQAALAIALALGNAAVAGPDDYTFEPLKVEVKMGEDAVVAARLIHKPTGKPVPDAVIFARRMDMAPDGMATMTADLEPLPVTEAGVYRFKTNLSMAGNWQVSLAAKVQGEIGTHQSRFGVRVRE